MYTQADVGVMKHKDSILITRSGRCPLRGIASNSPPVRRVKKSLLSIYITVMLDVFSHSSWNGW